MGNCKTKTRYQSHQTEETTPNPCQPSKIHINQRRYTGIFQDKSCPIDNEIIEETDKILQNSKIEVDTIMFGVKGQYFKQWKLVNLGNKREVWWYIGQWKQDKMHGRGYLYNTNSKYLIKGLFVAGTLSRLNCIKIFPNGSYYLGPLNQSFNPDGQGELHYPEGIRKYIGQFSNGVPHGQGRQIKMSQEFNGEFSGGQKKMGVLKQQNGTYTGQFQDNLKQGKGKYISKNGKVTEGVFQKNKYLHPIKQKQNRNFKLL